MDIRAVFTCLVLTLITAPSTFADAPTDLIFYDDFETGMSNWFTGPPSSPGVGPSLPMYWSSAQNVYPNDGSHCLYADNNACKVYHNLGIDLPGAFRATWYVYDGNIANAYGEVRSYAGRVVGQYGTSGLQQLYAAGKHDTGDPRYYQGRVIAGGPNWFDLNLAGAPNRSPGWHKFDIERLADGTTNWYIDNILSGTVVGTTMWPINFVALGLGSYNTVAGEAYYDGVKITADIPGVFWEGFDTLDASRWTIIPNGGDVHVANGKLSVTQSGSSANFPLIYSNTNPFPATGDFAMRVGIQFTGIHAYGSGVAASKVAPTISPIPLQPYEYQWQYKADQSDPSPGTAYHEIAWYFRGSQAMRFVDGVLDYSAACERPSCVWFGSPVTVGVAGPWSSFEMDYVHVLQNADTAPPSISLSALNATTSHANVIWLTGTASDDFGVASVTWTNAQGGSGACTGTVSWSSGWIPLSIGDNSITFTATDAAGHTATASTIVRYVPLAIGAIKCLPAGSLVTLESPTVTATGLVSGAVFVESADRCSGIKVVTGQPLAVGQQARITGTIQRIGGEYEIDVTSITNVNSGTPLSPVCVTTRSIGNDPTETLNYIGMNTTGLLVRVAGKVTGVISSQRLIYVDDGLNYQDGVGPVLGIRTHIPVGVSLPSTNKKVIITGVVRVEQITLTTWGNVNGDWYPAGTVVYVPSIWVRDANDIRVL